MSTPVRHKLDAVALAEVSHADLLSSAVDIVLIRDRPRSDASLWRPLVTFPCLRPAGSRTRSARLRLVLFSFARRTTQLSVLRQRATAEAEASSTTLQPSLVPPWTISALA